jgi:hypothetical protein
VHYSYSNKDYGFNLNSFIVNNNYLCSIVKNVWRNCKLLWWIVNSEESGEENSSDSAIIGDYETPSEYEPSEPRPHRRVEDDDVDYEHSDNEICMHIHSN